MPITNDALEKIKALSEAYAKQLPIKIDEMERLWQELKLHFSKEQHETLLRAAHTITGTSGTYGYKLVSDVARRIQSELSFHDSHLTPTQIDEVNTLFDDLKQLALRPPEMSLHSKVAFTKKTNVEVRTIYILDQDIADIKKEIEPITQFNYKVQFFNDVAAFLKQTNSDSPDMVVIDVRFADKIPAEAVKKFREDFILVIFLGPQDDLKTRLKTVRHGGQAFLMKPFELDDLLRTFDNLFQAKMTQNERILIVDDSEFLANYYSTLLKQADLVTNTVTDPKEFLVKLREFQPDLILMDVNMPYCNGIELAQIVHQQENLSGIPIIFLSSITERSRQLEVLSYAGDDFLTKPVDPRHLLAAVHNRLMRSRMLRFRMMRDSLTNLYNHTMIHHQLERELMMSERYKRQLCVVLFDIDHFKAVNDNYGHQAGDKILKDLSLFLQKHLRKSDLIGRYGGEEFLVILPNTPLDEAYALVDKLRKEFSEISHNVGTQEIKITFSGGIANYPTIKDSTQLIRAADNALYEAKENGRNKIISSA